MTQLDIIIKRLKKPKILISILAQVATILVIFDIGQEMGLISKALTVVCSLFTLLGIVTDPDTTANGYKDHIYLCDNCNKNTHHIIVNNTLVCKHCGTKKR